MRIVAGRFGGRRLAAPKGVTTRPTADRVREALFSILYDVTEHRVLDLYAGTGAVGLEALSRGAAHATFVEKDRAALDALEENLASLGISPGEHALLRRDAASVWAPLGQKQQRFELVFADPPYALAEKVLPELLQRAEELLADDGTIVLELRSKDAPPTAPARLELSDHRRYGEAALAFYTRPE